MSRAERLSFEVVADHLNAPVSRLTGLRLSRGNAIGHRRVAPRILRRRSVMMSDGCWEGFMTAVAEELRSTPLTVADYLALPEDNSFHWELQEGSLVMTPRPGYDHADAML